MSEALRPPPWLTFAGTVLVTAVLYWAQVVIVPAAFALLLVFVLTPAVTGLQRWIGRVPAVLGVVAIAMLGLAVVGWLVTQQLASLAGELPAYRQNIHQKISDIRGASEGGALEKLQRAIDQIDAELAGQRGAEASEPLVVEKDRTNGPWGIPLSVAPVITPLATLGLVVALVIAMLLERENLRDRLIRLFGHAQLVATTRAFDEAGWRVSRYLIVQSVFNAAFGVFVGVGLFFIGLPYSILFGALAGVLRYIPYAGPTVAALAPILLAFALAGWTKILLVVALFVVLELVLSLYLESAVFAGVAGISQVALLLAVAFWAWLWGPIGILLATPLTVCLAVLGKHIPGLEFVSTIVSDEPVLAPEMRFYQRLLAGDQAEAIELLERHVEEQPAESAYDAIMIPALTYAERDRIEGRLTAEEERAVIEGARELMAESPLRKDDAEPNESADARAPAEPIRVLGVPANGEADVVALRMLSDLLADTPFSIEQKPGQMLTSEVVEVLREEPYRAVCIVDLPPSPPVRSRAIAKRMRAIDAELPILVGRWAPPELADDSSDALRSAGASHVAATLLETRDQLLALRGVLAAKR
jgi:predicted PurR-regulated permease PerM